MLRCFHQTTCLCLRVVLLMSLDLFMVICSGKFYLLLLCYLSSIYLLLTQNLLFVACNFFVSRKSFLQSLIWSKSLSFASRFCFLCQCLLPSSFLLYFGKQAGSLPNDCFWWISEDEGVKKAYSPLCHTDCRCSCLSSCWRRGIQLLGSDKILLLWVMITWLRVREREIARWNIFFSKMFRLLPGSKNPRFSRRGLLDPILVHMPNGPAPVWAVRRGASKRAHYEQEKTDSRSQRSRNGCRDCGVNPL